MKSFGRMLICSLVFSLVIGSLAFRPANSQTISTQLNDPYRRLYENDAEFSKLSGAAQAVLELRFGKRKNASVAEQFPKSEQAPKTDETGGDEKVDLTLPIIFPSNVPVNNPALDTTDRDTQSETSIVLGAGSNVVVAYNDSGSLVVPGGHLTGFSLSTNGGTSFTDKGNLPPDPNLAGDGGDPVLARDKVTGTIYLATLGKNNMRNIQMFRSFDNGVSFTDPVNSTPGYGATDFFQDKPWIAVDNFPGSGQGNVYLAWSAMPNGNQDITGGIRFTRSTDGGNTWGPSLGVLIAPQGAVTTSNVQGAWVTVGPDHSVYVFWLDQSTGIDTPNILKVSKSVDRGVSFGPPVTIATLETKEMNGALGRDLGFNTNAFPQAVVNPVNGDIYVVYNDVEPGIDRGNIYFVISTDGGEKWGVPLRVNNDNDPATNDQWHPVIAVTNDGSHLFIGFYDRRLDDANSMINTFGTVWTIFGHVIFMGVEFRISNQAFPSVFGNDPGFMFGRYMGDYDQAVADDNFFYYSWGDNREPRVINAQQQQPDVRFARISEQ